MTKLELPDGMGPAEALRGFADDLLTPDAKLRAFVDFGKEGRWDSGPLEGATHGGFLRLVADLIDRKTTRNPADCTTVSAYDLLPDEDRDAIAWVREHGGVDAVRRDFQDADNQRVELCASLDIDLETGWADAMVAMRRRLMPEGMEWPRFETGEPVRLGDEFADGLGGTRVCTSVEFLACEEGVRDVLIHWDGDDPDNAMLVCMASGERVKRMAPKVLDADGVEIRVGDTVYDMVGDRHKVKGFGKQGDVLLEFHNDESLGWRPSNFTHRAPVLAADGRPLREGEHVYHVETGAELVVKELPKPGEYQAVVVFAPPASHLTSFDPDQLTHQRPDSWERLEDDADALLKAESNGKGSYNAANDYCNAHGLGTDGTVWVLVAQDLVRRAKKLSGVS